MKQLSERLDYALPLLCLERTNKEKYEKLNE